jgi:aspartyl-tRNA(Asn)/glutamyl-tRNA(Gln) amidotransferase subunit B
MFHSGKSAAEIVTEKGLIQISDPSEVQRIIDHVLQTNPDKVAAYQGGRESLMGFFVGQVMRETKGKANPQLVNDLLGKALAGG